MLLSIFDDMDNLKHPIIYNGREIITLEYADELEDADCVFGGGNTKGVARKFKLNKFFTFKEHVFNKELILFYGFNRECCRIKYRPRRDSIKIIKITPKSICEDFPYENYPETFPSIGYEISKKFNCSIDEFKQMFFGLFEEHLFTDILFILPPIINRETSLWGEVGDAEGVLLFSYINLKNMEVFSNNEIS